MTNRIKTIIGLLCNVMLFSCSGLRVGNSTFCDIFQNNGVVGNILPEYIILKSHPKTFEIYSPGAYLSVYGKWKTSEDTLFLFPLYKLVGYSIKDISACDSTELTIMHKYLIKQNQLIDITDYSPIANSSEVLNYNNYHPVYMRITSVQRSCLRRN